MNIIWVTAGMCGGGTERVISILANKWVEEGHGVTILATADNTVAYELNDKINLIQLGEKTKGNALKRIKRVFQMRSVFRAQKDAIICSMGIETNMYTVLATMGLSNYVLISERNDPGQCSYPKVRDWFYAKADKLICQTYDAEKYFDHIGKSKLCVIPNPINPQLPQPYQGIRRKVVIAAGRLTNQKNHKLLISAFEQFHKRHPEYTLEIFGEGELKEDLEEQIKSLGMQECATLKGFSGNLLEDIKDCSMYVLSSDYEGVSNSLLEAMAIGLPVVATDCPIGGTAMCIEHGVNGMLVPVGDEQALVEAMSMVSDNEEMASTISNNAIDIRERFSIQKVSDLWIEALKEGI